MAVSFRGPPHSARSVAPTTLHRRVLQVPHAHTFTERVLRGRGGGALRRAVPPGNFAGGNRGSRGLSQVATSETESASSSPGHVVIVGAGPAGALAAHNFAERGFTVDVYERSDIQVAGDLEVVGPRSYNILLNMRALAALNHAGVELTEAPGCFPVDTAMQLRAAFDQPRERASSDTWSVNRGVLASRLIEHCQSKHPDRVQFHFGKVLDTLDLDGKAAVFKDAIPAQDGADVGVETRAYDLLVGADGANSAVRMHLESRLPEFLVKQEVDAMEFRSANVLVEKDVPDEWHGRFFTCFDEEANATVIGSMQRVPEGGMRVAAVFILPGGKHAEIATEQDYIDYMHEHFTPTGMPESMLKALAAAYTGKPISKGGINTRCSQLHGPSTILIGDAGHSMWPSLGQGAVSALEDCVVLDKLMDTSPDVTALPEAYTDERHADALAVVELTERGMGGKNKDGKGMRAQSNDNFAVRLMAVTFILSKILPWVFQPPALMLAMTTDTPYSRCLNLLDWQKKEAIAAVTVVGFAVAAGVAKLLMFIRPFLRSAVGM